LQYLVLLGLYKINEIAVMWSNIAQHGCTNNAGVAGKNMRCAVQTIEASMGDAEGYNCTYNADAGFKFSTASDAYRKYEKPHRHTVLFAPIY
jgi:hypothetical protein